MLKQTFPVTGWIGMKRWLLLGALLAGASQAVAVDRLVRIDVPASATAGQDLSVTVGASTDAGKGEQVGFLQAETSVDDGKTWTAICYLQKSGPRVSHTANVKAGAAGTTVKVRVRVAFREGLAGDVDFKGAAIRWDGSWKEWRSPPAKHASVPVTAR